MKNSDMPAMPVVDEDGVLDCEKYEEFATKPLIATGLTKREQFAATLPRMEFSASPKTLEAVLGRNIDWDDVVAAMKAAAEIEAKFRVIRADALLAELEKTDD